MDTSTTIAVLDATIIRWTQKKLLPMVLDHNDPYVFTEKPKLSLIGGDFYQPVDTGPSFAGLGLAENGELPTGGEVHEDNLTPTPKTIFNPVTVTGHAIMKSAHTKGAIMKAGDRAIGAAVRGMKKAMTWSPYLTGNGRLATITNGTYANYESIVVTTGFKYLDVGNRIDIRDATGTAADASNSLGVIISAKWTSGGVNYISCVDSTGAQIAASLSASSDYVYIKNAYATLGSSSQVWPTGVQHILATTGTYLGIDRSLSANEWFKPWMVDTTTTTFNMALWETIWANWMSSGADPEDCVIITNPTIFAKLFEIKESTERSVPGGKMVYGWDNKASFNGIPVIWRHMCPDNTIIFWCKTNVQLVGWPTADVSSGDEQGPFGWLDWGAGNKWTILNNGGARRFAYEAQLMANVELYNPNPQWSGIMTAVTTIER